MTMGIFLTYLYIIAGVELSSAALFSCNGRTAGYYADIESDCQQYHVCTGGRLQYTYSCPNTTRFQQRMMICDHEQSVDCSKSEQDFSANLLLGQRGVPFVGADEFNSKQNEKRNFPQHIFQGIGTTTIKTLTRASFPSTHHTTSLFQPSPNPSSNQDLNLRNPSFNNQQSKPATQKLFISSPKPSVTNLPKVSPPYWITRSPPVNNPSKFTNYAFKSTSTTLKIFPRSSSFQQFSKQPSTASPLPKETPRFFSASNPQVFASPASRPRNIYPQTFVTTVSPIQDFPDQENTHPLTFVTTVSPIQDLPGPTSTEPNPQQWLRSLKASDNQRSFIQDNTLRENGLVNKKLEWTLPDVRAMLFIPDDPVDDVVPNIKRYSVTIPQQKMVFRTITENINFNSCPLNCDPRFMEPGTCRPCIMVK